MTRDLHHQGLNISQISRETGYHRNTVRKHLAAQTMPIPASRRTRPSKLDPFKDYIQQRIRDCPLSAARIYREIREMGFSGKYTIVKDHIRTIRPPTRVPAVFRYETEPGAQAQADRGEWGHLDVTALLLQHDPRALPDAICGLHPLHRYLHPHPVPPQCLRILRWIHLGDPVWQHQNGDPQTGAPRRRPPVEPEVRGLLLASWVHSQALQTLLSPDQREDRELDQVHEARPPPRRNLLTPQRHEPATSCSAAAPSPPHHPLSLSHRAACH